MIVKLRKFSRNKVSFVPLIKTKAGDQQINVINGHLEMFSSRET